MLHDVQVTLKSFIDKVFESILLVDYCTMPAAIKYLFDFFDASARRHNITDPEVVHVWKCNRYEQI